jgi:hypothetical protein
MKSAVMTVLIAISSMAIGAAAAKTVTNPSGNANEQSVNGVAGPSPKNVTSVRASHRPTRAALRKAKIKSPPPMHDPN